jgi:hypothetical protein
MDAVDRAKDKAFKGLFDEDGPSQTAHTLVGVKVADLTPKKEEPPKEAKPATADKPGNGAPALAPPSTKVTQASIPIVTLVPEEEAPLAKEASEPPPAEESLPQAAAATGLPWERLGRTLMGVGGATLVILFFMPWHGTTSFRLLETLAGADFVRQLFYLAGGVVLLTTALLPVPFVFRAGVGAGIAALPVVLGARGVIDGWRGVVAALAILGLPATHLLRSRAQRSEAARLLVLAAVAAVGLLYLVPIASVVPIAGVLKMIFSGSVGFTVMGLFILVPLVFAAMSLLGVMGRDLADIEVLLSVLILLWAPVVVALRGLLMDDGTQLYVAIALLLASATAALSLAQLLSLAAPPRA